MKNSRHRKKLLVLAPRWPYPPVAGGTLFLLNVAKALRGHRLTLLSLCNSREEMEYEPADGLFAEIHKVYHPKWKSAFSVLGALPTRTPLQLAYYRSNEFRNRVGELLPRHDAVFAHLIRTGQYVSGQTQCASVLLMADAISLAYSRMVKLSAGSSLWRWLYRLELDRLFTYECNAARGFHQTWLHSDTDRDFLGLDLEHVRTVPIGVDLDGFPYRRHSHGDVVAFIGNMSFSLNRDACFHFIQAILPLLRKEADIRFRVIGACPQKVKKQLERHRGVEVTGKVAKIADAVNGVFCGVCPLRAGAGIQNKILNYLALGIPCVTSRVGLEGLSAVEGSELLVYEREEDAAKMILSLRANFQSQVQLAKNGRGFVERAHDWVQIHKMVRSNVSDLLGSPEEDISLSYSPVHIGN